VAKLLNPTNYVMHQQV